MSGNTQPEMRGGLSDTERSNLCPRGIKKESKDSCLRFCYQENSVEEVSIPVIPQRVR